jgi:hypothetical protein
LAGGAWKATDGHCGTMQGAATTAYVSVKDSPGDLFRLASVGWMRLYMARPKPTDSTRATKLDEFSVAVRV